MTSFASPHSSWEGDVGQDARLGLLSSGHDIENHRSDTAFDEFLTDFSPEPPMGLNVNGGSSDSNLALSSFGFVLGTQMSQCFAENGTPNDYLLNTAQYMQGNDGAFEHSHDNPAMSFGQVSQNYNSSVGSFARNLDQNNQIYEEQVWYNGPSVDIKYEATAEDELISPNTLPMQNFPGQPWSIEAGSRYPGQVLPHHAAFRPSATTSTFDTSYPAYAHSVLSSAQASSPLGEGLSTPSLNRSPMFSHVAPDSSAGSSNGGDAQRRNFYSYDQIPRQLRTSFAYANQQDISPQHLLIDPTSMQQLHRDPSHSPLSDFVMIEQSDVLPSNHIEDHRYCQSKQKKAVMKRPRVVTTNNSRQESDNFVSEYPSRTPGPIRRQSSSAAKIAKDNSRRVGGRSPGMHLNEEAAARAKQLRDEGSCWICCFQRDSCSPGEECLRCQKRQLRSQMEHGLGCDRTKLNDLREFFIPEFLGRSGDKKVLHEFMGNHVRTWSNRPLKLRVHIVWGQDPMSLELYEFVPKTSELSRHLQSVVNKTTGKREWLNKGSPPLAMQQIDNVDRRGFERYIDEIIDNPAKLENFVERCYRFENDNFQRRLFRLIHNYQPTATNEKGLWKDIMRLQIITYIYCRASTVVEEDLPLLSTLQHAKSHRLQYGKSTTIRLANRQLKYLYTSIWMQNMENVLKKLQQILRSSSGGSKWSAGFIAVIGLGMAFESIQLMAHAHQEADQIMGNTTAWDGKEKAERACRVIDEKFFFLTSLFRWKYHRGFNPFKNIHDRDAHKTLGPQALELVQGVNELVTEKSEYLSYREQVAILAENKEKYTSRLVAKFLLGFWKPSMA